MWARLQQSLREVRQHLEHIEKVPGYSSLSCE